MDEERWRLAEATVSHALAGRPSSVRRQIGLFLKVLDWLAFLRHGRGLARLEPAATLRILEALERAPVLLLRRGVWGLRTLVFMGVWTQREAKTDVGYVASLGGWEDRPGAARPWDDRGGAAPAERWVLLADAEGTGPDVPGARWGGTDGPDPDEPGASHA